MEHKALGALGAAGALGVLLSGCGGGDGISILPPSYVSEDGGEKASAVPDGTTVGFLEVQAPSATEFVLRGTLPVPPGTYPRPDGLEPFTLLDRDGTEVVTQTEVVTRYPADPQGADVVEVIARVTRDPLVTPGVKLRYEVVQQPRAPLPDPGAAGVEDLVAGPASLPQPVFDLLGDPSALRISAFDVFGNEYVCHPLDGSGVAKLVRYGPVHSELRVYQDMLPVQSLSGNQGTLPHLFGVHAYLSTLQGSELLGLDLRFHNGHSGRNAASDRDDPLDKVYFERIEVGMPSGWYLEQDFEDPFFGKGALVGTERVYDMVAPNSDGSMHVMRWQGQFHRRLALTTNAERKRARDYLRCAGQGFCVPGSDPVSGMEYWSWWNRGTARYFPQNYQLPRLDHVTNIAGKLRGTHDWLEGHLTLGTSDGDYPVTSEVLGWGHPYGVAYGGMTGGPEIFIFDGVSTAWSASRWGFRTFRAYHRMHTDRQPNALYDLDGEPSTVEGWVRPSANGEYVPFDHYNLPTIKGNDPFGLWQAPQFQIQQVEGTGQQPPYESEHMRFDPHDSQHYIRYTRAPKVLVWLGNDSLSKDDLLLQAESFHLSFHPHNNTVNGGYQVTGLKSAKEYVKWTRASGFPFGRGESWGIDCVLSVYALADDAWRARKLPWLKEIAQVVSDGQASCSGFIQATVNGRFVNGKYRARQLIEQSITENMLQGMRETVFRDRDPAYSALVRDVLEDSLYASISRMAWFPGERAPWSFTAVGLANLSKPVWCNWSQIPGEGYTPIYETYQNWSSFAYAYELTGDPVFLAKATEEAGGGDLLTQLERSYLNNLENRAALLALAQRLYASP